MTFTNPVAQGIADAFADLTPPPRAMDVFMSRCQLARVAGLPEQTIYRAFSAGALTADALDARGNPLFFLGRLPQLKQTLEKLNSPSL